MKKIFFLLLVSIISFVLVSPNCWAIYLDQVEGTLDGGTPGVFYSAFSTDVTGTTVIREATNPTGTTLNDTINTLATANSMATGSAFGNFSNVYLDAGGNAVPIGDPTGQDYARFKFETTANINTYGNDEDGPVSATSVVNNTAGRIQLDIDPSDGENPGFVTLEARSKLHGNITGSNLGIAHFVLSFQIWDAPTGGNLLLQIDQNQTANVDPTVISYPYYGMINFDDDVLFPLVTATQDPLTDTLSTDDSLYVSFYQSLVVTSNGDQGSGASGALTYSLEDVYGTVFLDFQTGGQQTPTPEPASFLLLGIGLLGFGLSDKIKKMLPKNLFKS